MVRISTLDSILNKSYGLIEMWIEVSVWLFSNYCLQPCWSGKTDETRNGKVPAMAIAPNSCVMGTLEADRASTRQDWDFQTWLWMRSVTDCTYINESKDTSSVLWVLSPSYILFLHSLTFLFLHSLTFSSFFSPFQFFSLFKAFFPIPFCYKATF